MKKLLFLLATLPLMASAAAMKPACHPSQATTTASTL